MKAIEAELRACKLQVTSHATSKIIQLYETKLSRHSVMTVGCTLSAKSTSWKVLQATMTNLNKQGDPNFQVVKVSYCALCNTVKVPKRCLHFIHICICKLELTQKLDLDVSLIFISSF